MRKRTAVRLAADVAMTVVMLTGAQLVWTAHSADAPAKKDSVASKEVILDFEDLPIGRAPTGFTSAQTDGGQPAVWVVADDTSSRFGHRILAQTDNDKTGGRFPLCIYDAVIAKDVETSVQFKAVAGTVDQAAGLVVRYADKDNYYVVRANALEDNVRFYRVVKGKRIQIADKDIDVTLGLWHSLRLIARDSHFEVYLDGEKCLEADDKTFTAAGKVGVWTKADSVTYFDDLVIRSAPAQ
jgi:hypothetical protein